MAAPKKHRRRRGTLPPEPAGPAADAAGGSTPEPFDPQAYWPRFSCPHCFRRLDRIDLVPWFELLRCEWSGRSYLKVHDLKWNYELAALTPHAARALVCADAGERSAALALARTVGTSRVEVGALEEHLRSRVAAGAIERCETVEFSYLGHPRAVAWLAVPLLVGVLLALILGMVTFLPLILAVPGAAAVAAFTLSPLVGRLRRRPFRFTIAGTSLELALAGRVESWPIAEVTGHLMPPHLVARVYRRAGPMLLRHGAAEVTVRPDLRRFAELMRLLRVGGAAVTGA